MCVIGVLVSFCENESLIENSSLQQRRRLHSNTHTYTQTDQYKRLIRNGRQNIKCIITVVNLPI